MKRIKRFGLVLTVAEREALKQLASDEGISQAMMIRQLIRREALGRGVGFTKEHNQQAADLQLEVNHND